MARVSALYNILEDRISDVVIGSYYDAERSHALQLVNSFNHKTSPRQPILLMDRGYPSREMFYSLMEKNWHFLIRYTSKALQSVNEAPAGDTFVYDAFHNFPLMLRVIKATLPSGIQEILVTNLYESKYTIPMFLELYFLRLGVVTKYNEFKNRVYFQRSC